MMGGWSRSSTPGPSDESLGFFRLSFGGFDNKPGFQTWDNAPKNPSPYLRFNLSEDDPLCISVKFDEDTEGVKVSRHVDLSFSPSSGRLIEPRCATW